VQVRAPGNLPRAAGCRDANVRLFYPVNSAGAAGLAASLAAPWGGALPQAAHLEAPYRYQFYDPRQRRYYVEARQRHGAWRARGAAAATEHAELTGWSPLYDFAGSAGGVGITASLAIVAHEPLAPLCLVRRPWRPFWRPFGLRFTYVTSVLVKQY
jgi:hypothetical protein